MTPLDWTPRQIRIARAFLTFWLTLMLPPAFASTTYVEGVWSLQGSSIQTQAATSYEDCKAKWKALTAPAKQATVYCRQQLVTKVTATPSPPSVDCTVGAWSDWTGGSWSACVNGTQTRAEGRTRSVVTVPSNDGAACPALTETRTALQPCTVTPSPPPPPPASGSILLDDFEGSSILAIQPKSPESHKYQWQIVEGVGTGPTTLTTEDKHDGRQAIKSVFTGGDWQWHFFTYTEGLTGFKDGWHNIREFVKPASSWQLGKVNRLRFWIKLPPGIKSYKDGQQNFHFGTFVRCQTCTESESDNGHFYHYFNFESTGAWEQVIVDTIPTHQRSGNANADQPDRQFFAPGYTYFDAMVRFYLDMPWNPGGVANNSAFYMDGFELYQETRPENITQVNSIHGTYIPGENRVHVGWLHKKTETTVKHDVRYAFEDIYTLGWDKATPAGTVSPGTEPGYNSMLWNGTGLPLSGKSVVYIAIKPQNATAFRQIAIPLQ